MWVLTMNRKVREIIVDGDIAYVTLTKGYTAIVDSDMVETLQTHNWYALIADKGKKVYAARSTDINGKSVMILMHRVIAKTPEGMHTDHIDGCGINNRRSNLRSATPSQNAQNQGKQTTNTTGVKGVSYIKSRNKWQAAICFEGNKINIGRFNTKEEAYHAYCEKAKELHKDFANLG